MPRPFEVDFEYLQGHLSEMVESTFADLQSHFLVLPKGENFVGYPDFQDAYEVLKQYTQGFANLTEDTVWTALRADSLTFLVLRTILGMSPPEWADLARSDRNVDIPQGFARGLDSECRFNRAYFGGLTSPRNQIARERTQALVSVAVEYLQKGSPPAADNLVHRLNKVDTTHGLESLQHVANFHVPYAVLLYERYLGRPFASHRDSVSTIIGAVMESAIEEQLTRAGISFRKTKQAERVPGYEQAPDFFVPDEFNPAVLIEAKVIGDDGTVRDKVARMIRLATMSEDRIRAGGRGFEVVVCIDGRGFGVRKEDMRQLLLKTRGKVFTTATLDQMIEHTRLKDFLPEKGPEV